MSPDQLLLVSLAGGAGALLRYLADAWISRRTSGHPWATLLINVTGSFALALVTGLLATKEISADAARIAGVGLMGGFTTFSTAMWETVTLMREHRPFQALVQSVGMVFFCTLAAVIGLLAGGYGF